MATFGEPEELGPSQFLQYLLNQHSERRKTSDKVQCPQCMKKHRPREGPAQRASHGALEIFVEAACPICLEDAMGPPMIALACGHTLCPADFLKIGGKLTEVEEEDEQSSASEGETDEVTRMDLMRTLMENGILPMAPGGPEGNPFGIPARDPFTPRTLVDRNNNDDDGPRIVELNDDEPPAHDVPPMERESSDDDSDDSMPALASRHDDQSSDDSDIDDDDDDGSMPPLMSRNDQSSDDDSDDSMPPLARRRGEALMSSSDEDDDDDFVDESLGNPPPLGNSGGVSDDDSEDSDDSMPGLTSRDEQGDDDSESDASMPPLTGRADDRGSDDESDGDSDASEGSMPGLRPVTSSNNRGILSGGRTSTTSTSVAVAARPMVTDDDSSDGTSPPLTKRYDGEDSSDDDAMTGFKDDSDMSTSDDDNFHVGGSRTSTQPSGGILILVPVASDKSMVLKKVGRNNHTLPFEGSFHDSSKVIPSNNQMLVYSPNQGHGIVRRVRHTNGGRFQVGLHYNVPNNAQVMGDGDNGVWTLSSSTSNQRTKVLHNYNSRDTAGIQVKNFPNQSILYADMTGGCWVHVKEGNSSEKGIWQCNVSRQKKVMTVDPNVKIAHNNVGGIWILAPGGPLTHIKANGSRESYTIRVDVTKETKLITSTAEDGVFIHCRESQQWDLCHATVRARGGNVQVNRLCKCAKDAKIVSDKDGVAWIMQKERKERKLISVTRDGDVEKHRYQPPPGSIIGGL